jgi:hypothetical protein
MKKKTSKLYLLLASLFGSIFFTQPAQAFCPVCTVAVGVGVGLSRWLGIDDTISGVWIGGMIVALIMWAVDWLNKKEINFKFKTVITSIVFYALTIVPLYFTGIMGHPLNKILNVDKLLFGIVGGTIAFLAGVWINDFLLKDNDNKNYFPFQKVTLTLVMLLFMSLIFYIIVY